jgi:hypothetical protein
MPPPGGELRGYSGQMFADGYAVEQRQSGHHLRVVQGQPEGDVAAAVMAGQGELAVTQGGPPRRPPRHPRSWPGRGPSYSYCEPTCPGRCAVRRLVPGLGPGQTRLGPALGWAAQRGPGSAATGSATA